MYDYIHVIFVGSTRDNNFMSFPSKKLIWTIKTTLDVFRNEEFDHGSSNNNIFRDEGLLVRCLCLCRKSCYMYSDVTYTGFD